MDKETHNKGALQEEILKKIEGEHIAPKTKLYFIFQEVLLWLLLGMVLVVGSLSFAAMLFAEIHAGWEYYEATHTNMLTFAFHTLPVIWILSIVIALILTYYILRKTKRGYRFAFISVFMMSFLSIGLVGVFLHIFGAGYTVDHTIGSKLPFHLSAEMRERAVWDNPNFGRLVGTVVEDREDVYTLVDVRGTRWQLHYEDLLEEELALLAGDSTVRVLGVATPDMTFRVCAILPGGIEQNRAAISFDERRKLFKQVLRERIAFTDERDVVRMRSKECESVRSHIPLYTR